MLLAAVALFPVWSGEHRSTRFLGTTSAELISDVGAPARVYPERDPIGELEFVVFFYPDFRYFYFFDNRVWQVRLDRRSELSLLSFEIGDSIDAIAAELGPAVAVEEDSYLFDVPGRPFPTRYRAFVDEAGAAVDLYLFRADY